MTQNNPGKKIPTAFYLAAFIIIIAGIMYAQSIITSVLMALFVSIICAVPIFWLTEKKVPQTLAVFIVLFGIIFVFIGFGEIIATSLSSFSEDAPKYEKNLNEIGTSVIQFLQNKGIKISVDKMSNIIDPSKILRITAGLLGELGDLMGNAFTIFFLVVFLLLEVNSIPIKSKVILKESYNSLAYLDDIGQRIRHYLSIKTTTSLLTGVCIWICLEIIGVDYAIIWASIAFLLNYIPNIGSILAAAPALMFSLVQLGFVGVLWTGGVFLAVNVIIGNVVEPKMMGKGMGLSTFVVFVALLFWGFMLGTVGMFLSVPLTMAIKIMLEQHPETKWIAVILGSQEEAEALLEKEA